MQQRERNVRLTRGDFADVNGAMGWAVRMLDTELKGATSVRLEVVQVEALETGGDQSWATDWEVSVSGVITEPDRDPWIE